MESKPDPKVMHSIVQERVASLCNDGYTIQFRACDMKKYVYSLRHRMNGNRIMLYVYYTRNWLQQYTNGKITYNAPIWQNHASVV